MEFDNWYQWSIVLLPFWFPYGYYNSVHVKSGLVYGWTSNSEERISRLYSALRIIVRTDHLQCDISSWVADLASCLAWALASFHSAQWREIRVGKCVSLNIQYVILCYKIYNMVSTPSQMPSTVAFISYKLTQIGEIALGRWSLCVRLSEYFRGARCCFLSRSISPMTESVSSRFSQFCSNRLKIVPPPPTAPPDS